MNQTKLRRLLEQTVLIETDWPMSLGYRIGVLTDNPDAKPGHHVQTSGLRGLLTQLGGPDGCSGMSMRLDGDDRLHLIAIFCSEGGVRVHDGRLIELIAHECSHVVDFIEELAHSKMCTETRAYMSDWSSAGPVGGDAALVRGEDVADVTRVS